MKTRSLLALLFSLWTGPIMAQDGFGGWQNIAGGLKYVSVGADGTVWGVNAAESIFRYSGNNAWTQIPGPIVMQRKTIGGITMKVPVPGGLKQISVGGASHIWGVNKNDQIYRWTGNNWQQIAGRLKHVSVGTDGTVWGVNAADAIFRYNGDNTWTQIPGGLKQISVGGASHVWGVSNNDQIWRWTGNNWQQIAGGLKHVSVGADGTVWGVNAANAIYRYKGDNNWTQIPGALKQVSVGDANRVWGVNAGDQIYAAAVADEPVESVAEVPPGSIIQEVPDMPEHEIKQVMNWIKVKTTGVKLPFCWRQSYGRGVGTVLDTCAAGRVKIGALCYSKCPANTKRVGFDCHSVCPSGMRDDGLFCRAAEYGRGAGYPWKIGDTIGSLDGARRRCRKNHSQGCEKYGQIIYPKCKEGYSNVGCCICRPKKPDCSALGMNPGIDLSCAKKVTIGDPVPLICPNNKVEDAGLCYQKCRTGFNGVGPVCWQGCDAGWVNCAAGCAKTSTECGMVVADQVISPLIVAANIASLGLSTPATGAASAGVQTLKVGGKTVTGSTRLGKALIKAVDLAQSVKPSGLKPGASIFRRIWVARTGKPHKLVATTFKGNKLLNDATNDYTQAFADDFANQTSPGINRAIDNRFHPMTARFLKETWGRQQLAELAEANDWVIAQDVLAAVSIADITGVTGVVSAYAKPICQDVTPFPCVSAVTTYPSCPESL